jgi:hypothetical protein
LWLIGVVLDRGNAPNSMHYRGRISVEPGIGPVDRWVRLV